MSSGTISDALLQATANAFAIAGAQQALWITHPRHGQTFRMPVFVGNQKVGAKTEWVSVPK